MPAGGAAAIAVKITRLVAPANRQAVAVSRIKGGYYVS